MTLGEQIKQARERKNLSQEKLAEYLGVSRQAVSKWENGSSLPQGINREMLIKTLDLDVVNVQTTPNKNNVFLWMGWILAMILLVLFIGMCIHHKVKEQEATALASVENPEYDSPSLKSIRIYDSEQNEVTDEALWYNVAQIESILIQWDGGAPDSIKMFSVPSGSDTLEETELLLTKAVLHEDSAALLSADSLENIVQGHIYFELDFGGTVVTSEIYNVFYDSEIAEIQSGEM